MRFRRAGVIGLALLGLTVWASAARGQQSCDDSNPCTTQDICQADGSCVGVPLPNGTTCAVAGSGGCSTGTCFSVPIPGQPTFSVCEPVNMEPDGTACTYPGLAALGKCATGASCSTGFCLPQFVQCSPSGNACMPNVCDPSTGACHTFTLDCTNIDPCATGTCDPTKGCINMQPRNEGMSCDDGNSCTSNDQCHNGECMGSVGAVTPAPSSTPTQTQGLPPTDTPIPTPTPSASPSPTQPVTQTPVSTPAAKCAGDCNGDRQVTVNEIIAMVNVALGNSDVTACSAGDVNGDNQITVNEIIAAVGNALNGCPQALVQQ